jgi:hypothetical protein
MNKYKMVLLAEAVILVFASSAGASGAYGGR